MFLLTQNVGLWTKITWGKNLLCSFYLSFSFNFFNYLCLIQSPFAFSPFFFFFFFLFPLIPSFLFLLGAGHFGPSCCCFYTQDRSMNPGAFSSSGPLSWAMYLMRKGRTGSGLFGKADSSWHLTVIVITLVLSCHEIDINQCFWHVSVLSCAFKWDEVSWM